MDVRLHRRLPAGGRSRRWWAIGGWRSGVRGKLVVAKRRGRLNRKDRRAVAAGDWRLGNVEVVFDDAKALKIISPAVDWKHREGGNP